MAVEQLGEIYLCQVCGNAVEVISAGGGILMCCDHVLERTAEKYITTLVLPVNLPDSGV